MTTTYKTNLITSRNANLAEQHDLRERLKQLESEETQLKGAIAVLPSSKITTSDKHRFGVGVYELKLSSGLSFTRKNPSSRSYLGFLGYPAVGH